MSDKEFDFGRGLRDTAGVSPYPGEEGRAAVYHRRKADWHEKRRDSTGNANVAQSHRLSAMLKDKLKFDEMKDAPETPTAKGRFAFR